MSLYIIGIIGLAVFVLIVFLGMQIGVAMALVGFIGFSLVVSVKSALHVIASDFYSVFSSYLLVTLPLFILMGEILFSAGIGKKLYNLAYKWVGHLPGGLAMATTVGCSLFGAICGSPSATAATIGTVALSEMRRYKYDMGFAGGTVAAAGTLGIMIPPSITFIVYGMLVEESIGKLFVSGILPGILLTGLFMVTIYIVVRRNPALGPPSSKALWKEKIASLVGVWETLALFVLVIGGMFLGLFTPTEGAGIGAAGAILVGCMERTLTWKGFQDAFLSTLKTSCMVYVILAGATVFGRFMAVSRIPADLASWVGGLSIHPLGIMALIYLIYFIGGCLMESLPLILLTVPIFLPVVKNLGFDPIWFGVIIVILGEIGLITPPVGLCVYVTKGLIPDVPMEKIFQGAILFTLPLVVGLIIITLFPEIALLLPRLMD